MTGTWWPVTVIDASPAGLISARLITDVGGYPPPMDDDTTDPTPTDSIEDDLEQLDEIVDDDPTGQAGYVRDDSDPKGEREPS